jgi:hypothetical protein
MNELISLNYRDNLVYKGNYNHIVCRVLRKAYYCAGNRKNFPIITDDLRREATGMA